jgi:spermidine synthase
MAAGPVHLKPWRTLRSASVEGASLVLKERAGEFLVQADGKVLMSSRRHGSEEALATAACTGLKARAPRVLIGGLGLGYSVRATLGLLPPNAEVTVSEISADLVEWNRTVLAELASRPLEDPRVRVEVGDVGDLLAGKAAHWDAILLDVDNGPVAVTRPQNAGLYGTRGIAATRRALREAGTLAVWSAGPDARFEAALKKGGFHVDVRFVSASGGSGAKHVIFAARAGGRP